MSSLMLQVVEQVAVAQVPSVPPVPPVPQAPSAPEAERVIVSKDGKTVSIGQDGRVIVRETGTAVPSVANVPMIPSQAVDISLAFFAMIAFIAVGGPLARAFARRLDRKTLAPAPTVDADRLSRIEQSLEAVALEVERIGEGQRYVTQLMSNRNDALRVGSGQ